ncbi:MAG: hypothetical protein H7257_09745 [Taibaiella sp.]|nr:hypothetical protein [Taibaiella sp.]
MDNILQKHRIFVEGKADQVFIRDMLKLFYDISLNEEQLPQIIININGKDRLHKFVPTLQEINNGKRNGGNNLVIFDSDYYEIDSGIETRQSWLEGLKSELGIKFQCFLFTDKKEKEGTIESLLETCIHPEHKGIFSCWEGFEQCVKGVSEKYTIPAKKSKIYLYLECLHGPTKKEKDKIKDPNRDFLEEGIWNFDVINNPLLNELKIFLDKHLS